MNFNWIQAKRIPAASIYPFEVNHRMKCALPIALALVTAGMAMAQQQPQYQQQQPQPLPPPAEYPQQPQYPPQAYPEQARRGDMTAMLGAMNQAMNGLRRLNDINNLPPEMQNTEQNRAAKRAAMMMTSTAISAAIGAAATKDHVKGAMIGAAVGGVVAMIVEEAQNSKQRRATQYGPLPPAPPDNRLRQE